MSDTVTLPATGAVIATDQVADGSLGTVHVQYVKLMGGALDDTTKVGANSNGLLVDGSGVTQPVSLSSVPTHAVTQSGTWTVQPGNTANTTAWKVDGSAVTQPVSGTVTANAGTGTMAVSAASLPLPSGASTSAKQPALGTAGSASADVITVQGVTSMTALKVDGSGVTQPVSGTFWQATQPVSAASLPLPSGAATSAKQPALGTAGTAATDVITIQGITSMTALKVDGSATTQPVSGTVTANAGTGTMAVSAASLPLPSGASTAAKQPALGTAGTAASDVITVQGITSMTALKVDGSGVTQPVSGTFWQATQPVSGTVTVQQSTASSLKVDLSGTAANTTAIKVDGSAVTQPISVASIPTHAVTQSGTWTVQPGNTANSTAWLVQTVTGTTGGWSVNSQTALTNTKVAVKASAGNFGGYMLYNPNSVVIFIQVWDVASGSVTVGTTAPTYVIPIPATAGANLEIRNGVTHATAITLAATTTATGSTAPTTALTGFFLFK